MSNVRTIDTHTHICTLETAAMLTKAGVKVTITPDDAENAAFDVNGVVYRPFPTSGFDIPRRLKDMGLKDFIFVFVGEDGGNARYAGEIWDQVLASELTDVVRLIGPVDDMPAAYAAASVVVSAAIQTEGLQRTILEAQAMERPVVASDLGAGPDAVLAPPMS